MSRSEIQTVSRLHQATVKKFAREMPIRSTVESAAKMPTNFVSHAEATAFAQANVE